MCGGRGDLSGGALTGGIEKIFRHIASVFGPSAVRFDARQAMEELTRSGESGVWVG
jgi:hypothetical protein